MDIRTVRVNIKALPDWLMRREKLCIAALLGHSGTHRTRVRLRSSFGRALHYTSFDDANEITESSANPSMMLECFRSFLQTNTMFVKTTVRQRFIPARWGLAPDYIFYRLKMILFDVNGSL